jgi:hypothetical protein
MGVERNLDSLLALLQGHVTSVDGIAKALLPANGEAQWNGATWDVLRTANKFVSLAAVAIGAEATLWTPAAGKKFRLMGGLVSIGTAAGNVTIRDGTALATILVLPKAGLDTPFALPPMGNGILSGAANRLLTGQGVATATISGFLFGTEE